MLLEDERVFLLTGLMVVVLLAVLIIEKAVPYRHEGIWKILLPLGSAVVLLLGLLMYARDIRNAAYAEKMKDLDLDKAVGMKIVAFDMEKGKFTTDYVPKDLLAGSAEEVGYVLQITEKRVSELYWRSSGGYQNVYGEHIQVELVDCISGEVIGEETFMTRFPSVIKEGSRPSDVEQEEILKWVAMYHKYAQMQREGLIRP